jgi:hypothetical protein
MPVIVGTPFDHQPKRSIGIVRLVLHRFGHRWSNIDMLEVGRRTSIDPLFGTVNLGYDMEEFLRSKFLGFDNLLGTVDALVLERDLGNFERIAGRLGHIIDQTRRTIENLEVKLELLSNLRDHTQSLPYRLVL